MTVLDSMEDRIVSANDNDDDAERRDTFRMPMSHQVHQAKLKVGKTLVQVQVLDESAGGFLISGQRIPKTNPGDGVELFNSNGAHFLRLAWRRNVDGETRLGLQRSWQAPPQEESPLLIWLVAAVVIGIGVGFVTAMNGQANVFQQLLETQQTVTNAADGTQQ